MVGFVRSSHKCERKEQGQDEAERRTIQFCRQNCQYINFKLSIYSISLMYREKLLLWPVRFSVECGEGRSAKNMF